jgi:hypothetical protein
MNVRTKRRSWGAALGMVRGVFHRLLYVSSYTVAGSAARVCSHRPWNFARLLHTPAQAPCMHSKIGPQLPTPQKDYGANITHRRTTHFDE